MKSIVLLAGGLLATCSLGACATVTRGTNTAWQVNTTPPGAAVKTSNGFYCESTPCSLKMPRKSEFTATISHPGYKPVDVTVTNHVSNGGGVGMAGNVLLGGVIGAGVDVASGAMLDLTPNPVTLTMERVDDIPPPAAPDLAPTASAPVPPVLGPPMPLPNAAAPSQGTP